MNEWETEPNRKHWIDQDSGLDCLIIRNPHFLSLCGYVGVPRSHPWYGKSFDDLDVEVHGGLTFVGPCVGHICHDATTEPVANVDVYWLGFDCGHSFDFMPGLQKEIRDGMAKIFDIPERMLPEETYKNMDYVTEECRKLAAQAKYAR